MTLVLLHGDNVLDLDEAARLIRDSFEPADVLTYEGTTVPLGTLSQACRTAGLFDPERLVIVHRLHERLKGSKKETDAEELRKLFLSLAPTTTLLLLCPDMTGDHILVDWIREAGGSVRIFSLAKKGELTQWVRARARKHKASIDVGAAELLIDLAGNNSVLLDTELEKLAIYAGVDQRITTLMVESLVGAVTQESIFSLVDAIAAGDQAKALSLLQEQMRQATTMPIEFALYLIRMLARQVRILLRIRLGQEANRTQSQIVSDLRLPRYFAGRYFQQARRLTRLQLTGAFTLLAELEYGLKSGRADPTTGLNLLITDLCA